MESKKELAKMLTEIVSEIGERQNNELIKISVKLDKMQYKFRELNPKELFENKNTNNTRDLLIILAQADELLDKIIKENGSDKKCMR